MNFYVDCFESITLKDNYLLVEVYERRNCSQFLKIHMINRFKLEKQFSICNIYPELISPLKYYVSKDVY